MSYKLVRLVYERRVGSSSEKSILLHMAECANDTGSGIFKSHKSMVDEIECSMTTLIKALKSLLRKGLIEKAGERIYKGSPRMEYWLNVEAIEELPPARKDKSRSNVVPLRGTDLDPLRGADLQGGTDLTLRGSDFVPEGVQICVRGGPDLEPTLQKTLQKTQSLGLRAAADHGCADDAEHSAREPIPDGWRPTPRGWRFALGLGLWPSEIEAEVGPFIARKRLWDDRETPEGWERHWESWVKGRANQQKTNDRQFLKRKPDALFTRLGVPMPRQILPERYWDAAIRGGSKLVDELRHASQARPNNEDIIPF